jgi:hypothetical protein
MHFKPIGVGRDFLLPFLSRKKGESNKKLSNDPINYVTPLGF